MQVSQPNDVKIYNLSAGKSLPEWLSERRRRLLQKEDIDIRRRIELIQDFEMPTASTNIEISEDGNYILASGCYKPRIKCYDVSQMSMKFERCLDSDIVKFCILSDNYSKLVFLNCDRYVEFHAQYGRYYRTRIPKFGRDLVYHYPSCDLYLVGQSSEIYRLNLEQGRFLSPFQTEAESINCCDINPVHQLLAVGTSQGQVECWDPRSRTRVGQLDVASNNLVSESGETQLPEVTTLKYRDGLMLGLGTSTGHVLLYDIRSDKPMLIKDHQYGLPITSIAFQNDVDMVLSTDSKILKIWHRDTGKPFTAVEPGTNINNLCVCPNSGLLFMATEAPKILIYYIPSLGPAPRWCSFLDSLTEELEEDAQPVVYDDYKFVTKQDLESLGLSHLMGTNLLRAYMHGFFIDIRLYHKAKAIAEPFAYEDYRKNRIKQKIEEERSNRVIAKKLPKINRQLAEKLLDDASESHKPGKVNISNPLGDDRFASIFTNPDFQVDETSEQYQLLHPVISKRDKERKEKQKDIARHLENFDEVADEEVEGVASEDDESSSEDDYEWRQELKKQQKELRKNASSKQPKFYELKSGEEFTGVKNTGDERRTKMVSLGDRLGEGLDTSIIRSSGSSFGGKEIVFKVQKNKQEMEKEDAARAHRTERRKVRRSANSILPKQKRGGVFWKGKRVR